MTTQTIGKPPRSVDSLRSATKLGHQVVFDHLCLESAVASDSMTVATGPGAGGSKNQIAVWIEDHLFLTPP